MSSGPNPMKEADAASNGTGRDGTKLAPAVSADKEPPRAITKSSNVEREGSEGERKAPSALSEDANDPPPSRRTSHSQSDAASVTSAASQSEGMRARARTRAHYTRSKESDGQQNGDKRDHDQVSLLSTIAP